MNVFLRARTEPMIIAHRGASADAPENTMAAFREAVRQKADAIEMDVQLTADNELVIMHDPTLGRTTDGHGLVHQKTLQAIKSLDAGKKFSKKFTNEPIPTLDEVLDSFGKQTNYVIELKFYRFTVGSLAKQVLEAVESRHLLEHVLFLSFDPRLLKAVKKLNAKAKTCWAFIPILDWRPSARSAARFDALAIASRHANADYTDRLHQLGKPVNLWTGSKENYATEISAKTEFITTNHPARLREALNEARANKEA